MRIVAAILLSLLFHGLLLTGTGMYMAYGPSSRSLPTLDLSSVEVSFAETDEEVESVMPLPASTPRVPTRPREERMPDVTEAKPLPPDPEAPKFREPTEAKPTMEELPPVERPEEQESAVAAEARPTVQAARQARVDAPPRPRRNIRPDYPSGARQRGEQGDVVLEIRVENDGSVSDVKVLASSGFAELDEAAVKAAKKARFVPARSGDGPVSASARLKLSFKLK